MGNAREGLIAEPQNDAMETLLNGSALIDVVILATLVEWAALTALWKHRGRGVPPGILSWMLLPGLCLMLAVRSAMLGAPWYWLALLLMVAGLAHLVDLRGRWRH